MKPKPKTWHDMVRMVFFDVSDRDADRLLWEATCFPFGKPSQVFRDLRDGFELGGGTVHGAITRSYAELDKAMSERAIA